MNCLTRLRVVSGTGDMFVYMYEPLGNGMYGATAGTTCVRLDPGGYFYVETQLTGAATGSPVYEVLGQVGGTPATVAYAEVVQ